MNALEKLFLSTRCIRQKWKKNRVFKASYVFLIPPTAIIITVSQDSEKNNVQLYVGGNKPYWYKQIIERSPRLNNLFVPGCVRFMRRLIRTLKEAK